jgi:hypothetical protein
VIAAHEEALRHLQPEFLEAYRAMNRLATRVLAREPEPLLMELNAISAADSKLPGLSARAKGGHE